MSVKVVKSIASQTKRKILYRKILELPLDNVVHKDNMRTKYKDSDMSELMTSMKQNGLLQPIGVKELPEGEYEILFGNRRFLAAEKLGWDTIDAQVLEAKTDIDKLIIHAIENVQRVDVPFTEQGRIYAELTALGLSKSEVAARMGLTLKTVKDAILAYNHVPAKYRDKVVPRQIGRSNQRQGKVRPTAAMSIESLRKRGLVNLKQAEQLYDFASQDGTDARQIRVLGELMKEGFNLDEAQELIDDIKTVTISLSVSKKTVENLEEQYKTSYHAILYSVLASHKELGIIAGGQKTKAQILDKLGLTQAQIKELKG